MTGEERLITLPLGVVVERRPATSRWLKEVWRCIGVLPGAAPLTAPKLLLTQGEVQRYHLATLPLEAHRKETEAYRANLLTATPKVYVVLRPAASAQPPLRAVAATVSPYRAQDYLDTAEDQVEALAMPEGLRAWLEAFTERHHVETPFYKRKRDPARPRDESAPPPVATRKPNKSRLGE